jgi:hypothetical protein
MGFDIPIADWFRGPLLDERRIREEGFLHPYGGSGNSMSPGSKTMTTCCGACSCFRPGIMRLPWAAALFASMLMTRFRLGSTLPELFRRGLRETTK